jgi:predicted Zn-dependent protease with MMP-like domain
VAVCACAVFAIGKPPSATANPSAAIMIRIVTPQTAISMIPKSGCRFSPTNGFVCREIMPQKNAAKSPIDARPSTAGTALCRRIAMSWELARQGNMWHQAKAPDLAEMEDMAHAMLALLPEDFRKLCAGVIIRVDDFPTDEVLEEMQAETEFDLLGLFQGVGLPFQSQDNTGQLPNMIWLYRRPILDYWAEHDETLGHIVRHVLIHEIGHHFGLSDADMEAIEAGVAD